MKLVLIVFGTLWPLLMQVVYGVQNVDAVAGRHRARVPAQRARGGCVAVVLPSAAPFIATGLRVAGVTALLLSIVTELVGGAPGLGLRITRSQNAADYADLYALVVVTGAAGDRGQQRAAPDRAPDAALAARAPGGGGMTAARERVLALELWLPGRAWSRRGGC